MEVVINVAVVGMSSPSVAVAHAMDWVVLVVVADLVPVSMVDIVCPSVEISILDLVVLDAVVSSRLDLMEKIVVFVLDVFFELRSMVEFSIMWVCVAMMLAVEVMEIVAVFPVGMVVDRELVLDEVAVVHDSMDVMEIRVWPELWGRLVVEIVVASMFANHVGQVELSMVVGMDHSFVLVMRGCMMDVLMVGSLMMWCFMVWRCVVRCLMMWCFIVWRCVMRCLMVMSRMVWCLMMRSLRVWSVMVWHIHMWVFVVVNFVMMLGKLRLMVLDLMRV